MRKYVDGYVVNYKREVHKSIRLDDRIYKYIMQLSGENFSDKLENLVIDHAKLTDRLMDVRR